LVPPSAVTATNPITPRITIFFNIAEHLADYSDEGGSAVPNTGLLPP
jgi:hypothetical protein